MTRFTLPFLLAATVGLVATASAQNLRFGTRGSMLLQGGIGYMYQGGEADTNGNKVDTPTSHTITLAPEFGYFVIDGLHLGIVAKYIRTSTENAAKTEQIASTAAFALRPAYYFALMPSRALSLYLRGGIGYANSTVETTPDGGSGTEESASGFYGGAGAGLAFAFGGAWGGVIQLGLDYTYLGLTQETQGSNVETDVSTNILTFETSFGVYF